MAKSKIKKRKPAKKKPAPKKRGRVSSKKKSNKFLKRRGERLYDYFLQTGSKRETDIDSIIDSIDLTALRDDDEFVKITFVSGFRKKRASISYVLNYEYEDRKDFREQLRQTLKDINYTIFRKPVKGTGDSIKRMNRLKNFLNRIIIDFETAS
jgi:hypothetical protein